MTDLEPVCSKGWRSAVRVRLLHSQARLRIMDGRGRHGTYSVADDGGACPLFGAELGVDTCPVAINQEDLAATLGSFSIAPIWSLRRMGVGLSRREEEAFVACWRHIGYCAFASGPLPQHTHKM
jgi:hypothetical protein